MKALRTGLSACFLVGCIVDGHYVEPEAPRPGEALWVKQLGSDAHDSGTAIAIDSDDNLIAAGIFNGTLLAGAELTSNGGNDIYVVKLASSTGGVIWAKRLGGISDEFAHSLVVDGSNNIYLSGWFSGTVDFGGGPLTAVGPASSFVLKLDADGGFGWARKIDADTYAIAANGDTVVVTGDYAGSLTIDTTTLVSVGTIDMFAVKVSASTGATSWIRSFGGTSQVHTKGAALDSSGNVVLTGKFRGNVDFGGGLLSTPGELVERGFLLKLADANGAHLLSRQFGKGQLAEGVAVAVDSANNIFLTGAFTQTADFGCTNSLTAQPQAVFLVNYTQAGSCVWAKEFGGTATARGPDAFSIAVNSTGDVATTGAFCGSISFGGETLSSASACGGMDVFAARHAADGTHLKSVRAGGPEVDRGLGIAQSADGRIFVTGEFAGFSEFGSDALNSIGATDAFIAGFAPL